MYIKRIIYLYLTPIFRLHKIQLEFSVCLHKFKWLLCNKNPVLNTDFNDYCCTNKNSKYNFKKDKKNVFKAKKSPYMYNTNF